MPGNQINNTLTSDQKDYVIKNYKSLTNNVLAATLGMSKQKLRNNLKLMGLVTPPVNRVDACNGLFVVNKHENWIV